MDYLDILQLMKARKQDALEVSERERIGKEIRKLEKWVQTGQAGECPVDVTPYMSTADMVSQTTDELGVAHTADEMTLPEEDFDREEHILEERNQRVLREELEHARKLSAEGNYRQAVAVASQVAERASGNLQNVAAEFLAQTRMLLSQALNQALDQGDAARERGDVESARQAYRQALSLDVENGHARQALLDLDRQYGTITLNEQLARIRAGLKERRDIKRLGEAVYEAEALQEEHQLPPDFSDLVKEARQNYDEIRRQHGEGTTMMRYGNVDVRAKAVSNLEQALVRGEKFIWDMTLNIERPVEEVLKEARQLLREASEQTAQYELAMAERYKTTRPQYIGDRLRQALEQPFQDNDRKMLEERLVEVERFIESQKKAESLQEKALGEEDPLQRLGYLLEAQVVFSSAPGLKEQINQARLSAEAALESSLSDAIQRAGLALGRQAFDDARDILLKAENLAAGWPEDKKPDVIIHLLQDSKKLRGEIDDTERAYAEYQSLALQIRERVKKNDERVTALSLFDKVKDDERFRKFPDLRVLATELDQYRNVSEQWVEAQKARDEGDWGRAYQIARSVIEAGAAGQLASQFWSLQEDALTEINIARAQDLLESDEIREANAILTSTIKRESDRDPERGAYLKERLKEDLERVQAAIQNDAPMRSLYEQACNRLGLAEQVAFQIFLAPTFALRQAKVGADGQVVNSRWRAFINSAKESADAPDPLPDELTLLAKQKMLEFLKSKSVEEQFHALRLLRYVGGISNEKDGDWPPYHLSLRTADARRAALLIAESLRQYILPLLREKYREFLGREAELNDEVLGQLSDYAGQLRTAALLETEDERSMARWAEIHWGKRQALAAEKMANWEGAIQAWSKLERHYPGYSDVRYGLRRAQVNQVIQKARHLLYNDHKGGEAITMLKDFQRQPEMDSVLEIYLVLAEIYAEMGEFEAAFGNLSQLERLVENIPPESRPEIQTQIEACRQNIEQEELAAYYLGEARCKESNGNPAEALRVLQEGVENERLRDKTALQNLRDEIYHRASETLHDKVQKGQAVGTNEGKIQAVIALVELQHLEDIIGVPKEKRRSGESLNLLRAELVTVAESVVREATDIDFVNMPLPRAIQKAEELSARLQLFVTSVFGELETVRERLTRRRQDMALNLENLRELERILLQTNQPAQWDEAVRTGDFRVFEQALQRIRRLELSQMAEARTFERRIQEMQEIYNHLIYSINETKEKFKEDNFSEVQRLTVEAGVLPSFREDGQIWQTVSAKEYEKIYLSMGDRLRIPDIYGMGDLVGWDDVLKQAEERQQELDIWRAWDRQSEYKMDMAEKALLATEAHNDSVPIRQRKADWEGLRDAAREAIQVLTYPLQQGAVGTQEGVPSAEDTAVLKVGVLNANGQPIPARSREARQILKEGERRKVVAEGWLYNALSEIDVLESALQQRGFPSEAEFAEATAQKDALRLERLLERARRAGITDEAERKRVETYQRVLNEMKSRKRMFHDIFKGLGI